jgi:hypothetical protein
VSLWKFLVSGKKERDKFIAGSGQRRRTIGLELSPKEVSSNQTRRGVRR